MNIARTLILLLSLLLAGGCASTGGPAGELKPTYVLVLTVDSKHLANFGDIHCAADCSPGHVNLGHSHEDIFLVEDVPYKGRQFSQMMISPRWHQPDLEKARKWGSCVIEGLEAAPDYGFVVTSAYLIRVLAPLDSLKPAIHTTDGCRFERRARK